MEKEYQEIIKQIKIKEFETNLKKKLGDIKSTAKLIKRMTNALFEYNLLIMGYIMNNKLDEPVLIDLLKYINRITVFSATIEGLSKSVIFLKNLKICIQTDIINSNAWDNFDFSYTEAYINELTKTAKKFDVRRLMIK